MRAFKFIHDPRAFEIVADETRRKMIYLLRVKELTVSQLAEQLGKTPQAIYHQIKKLLEVGLVEVAREERVDHFIETYYRATAEVFEFHHGEGAPAQSEMDMTEALDALKRLGIDITVDEDLVKEATQAELRNESVGLDPELERKIAELTDIGFLTKGTVYKIAQLALMSDKEFEEKISSERALRKLISSRVRKRQKH